MNEFLKLNRWLAVLTLVSWTFLSFWAMETQGCVEVDLSRQSYKAGVCKEQ